MSVRDVRRQATAAGRNAQTSAEYAKACRHALGEGEADREIALDLALCSMASARAASRYAEQCVGLAQSQPADLTSIELAVSAASHALAYAVETLELVLKAESERLVWARDLPEAAEIRRRRWARKKTLGWRA